MKGRKFLLWLGLVAVVCGALWLADAGRVPSLKAQAAPLGAVFGAPAMGSAHFGLDWDVVSAGGGEIDSTHFQVASTIGQAAAGNISSDHFAVHTGYRQNMRTLYQLYLPIVLRLS